MHVPVSVWSGIGSAWIDLSVLKNNNLVLVVGEWDLMEEDWVENWLGLPVCIVLTPLLLVSCLIGWNCLWERLWTSGKSIVTFAGSNNSVIKVFIERNFFSSEGSVTAVWQLNPFLFELNQRCWLTLGVMEWGTLHEDVLAKVLVATHTGGVLLVESESTLAPEKQ